MRRLVALLVAVGLVALAVVIRNGIDNGGSGTSGNALRLVCAPELAKVCSALGAGEVVVEDPGVTADRLERASSDLGLDGWLTPGPWPEIVREARQRAGKDALLNVGSPLGRSRVGLAVWPDRLPVLMTACPNRNLSWRCVGDVASKGQWTAVGGPAAWGAIRVGIPDPSSDATGLAALGTATVGWFGRSDLSSADLDDPGFRAWLRALAVANADHPGLEDVLARGPAEAAAAATFEAVATPALAATARNPKPVLTYPAPVARADVVLGIADTDRGRGLAGQVNRDGPGALTKAGWEAPGQATALPSPGLLDALREAWKEASR